MVKITGLPTNPAPALTDLVPEVTGSTNKNTWAQILALFFANVPAGTALDTPTIKSPIQKQVTGWQLADYLPTTITDNGNRSYNVVVNSTDLTGYISKGMRLWLTRNTASPQKCTTLNGTTQYWLKTSPNKMTWTDDMVASAWIKVSSYTGAIQIIASRYNGTSGWRFYIETDGHVILAGYNAGSGNNSYVKSNMAIPLNKWVHVAAQLDMSTFTATTTTSFVMFDGLDVGATVSRNGTNPTSLVQAGNLEIGGSNGGGSPFGGQIAQLAIYSAKVTQAVIAASKNQTLAGTETSLASAYSFSATANDLNTTTPNNLTAQNSAVATTSDSPYGGGVSATKEFGIIQTIAFSTNTTMVVQVPEGYAFPTTGSIIEMSYSNQKIPYLFPAEPDKWSLVAINRTDPVQTPSVSATWYNLGGTFINLPIGAWRTSYKVSTYIGDTSGGRTFEVALSSSTSSASDDRFHVEWETAGGVSQQLAQALAIPPEDIAAAALTPYYLITRQQSSTGAIYNFGGRNGGTMVKAVNGYL